MKGKIDQLEARIELTIAGHNNESVSLACVIDTGFTGSLTLSQTIIHELDLPLVGKRQVMLGDGSIANLSVYNAKVMWHGSWKNVLVLGVDGDTLLGISLLMGSRIALDVIDGGLVSIDPIPKG
ncbi:MAG: clan AA aspartic protease [Pirellulales bacterium]|nr:clan AA aspartic protease [Pirellulales bacterium]